MNCELHELQGMDVELQQVKEVLKVLMHSIIFQRALGEYRFRDTESELFEVTYVRCDSRLVDQMVEDYADTFSKAFERSDSPSAQSLCVSFFERRMRPAAFGFFRSEEKVTWERWHVPIRIMPPLEAGSGALDRRRRQQELEAMLRSQLELVLSLAASREPQP
jgi:autophagy-related protein 101